MRKKKNSQPEYQKLSRRCGSLATYHQIWCGADHLLLIHEAGCVEEYKRFYFQDIQALVVVRSMSFYFWVAVLPLFMLLLLTIPAFATPGSFLEWFSSGLYWIAGFFGIIWLFHLLQGPTCKCWIQTGINREPLPMFKRIRQSKRFWEKIELKLIAAQGNFSLNEMNRIGETETPQ